MNNIPNKPGIYTVSCMESDYTKVTVKIYRQNGQLKVDDPDIGKGYLLNDYNYNLTDVKWKLIGW